MIKLDIDHIAKRANEIGWQDQNEELLTLIDTIIEDEVSTQYSQRSDRLGDVDEMFEYTAKARKQAQQRAIDLQKSNPVEAKSQEGGGK